jgi:hypothetical protein
MHPDPSFVVYSLVLQDSMLQDSMLFSYFATFWQETMGFPSIADFAQDPGLFADPPPMQDTVPPSPVCVKLHSR